MKPDENNVVRTSGGHSKRRGSLCATLHLLFSLSLSPPHPLVLAGRYVQHVAPTDLWVGS
jgi:hypothetical protein